jgi:TM2 domain-containing membrane protein YozV
MSGISITLKIKKCETYFSSSKVIQGKQHCRLLSYGWLVLRKYCLFMGFIIVQLAKKLYNQKNGIDIGI